MRITELARAAGVNKETLRYYERRGLLDPPVRSPGGHRLYDERSLHTLRVVKAAQRLGFTLDEVDELLELGRGHGRRAALPERARTKLGEVDERIADLRTIRGHLLDVLDAGCDDLHVCAGNGCCPLPFAEIATRQAEYTPEPTQD